MGLVVAALPWARHGSGFTRSFEDQVAWLATECSKTAACELTRISWRTVGRIIARVAYLLKEQLRQVLRLPTKPALAMLEDWLIWARRCRLKPFVKLAKNIMAYLPDIENSLLHPLSNALVESVNTRIRLITRRAFGFHGPAPLIALVMLSLGGLCPPLPGRS